MVHSSDLTTEMDDVSNTRRIRMIPFGFRLAGAANIVGVLVFSLAFTNERLIKLNPAVLSRFGLISIMLWGLAYLSVASSYTAVPFLIGVFALEKLIYVVSWLVWIREHGQELPSLFTESPLTATFYTFYGPNDFIFGVFFAYVAMRDLRAKRKTEGT